MNNSLNRVIDWLCLSLFFILITFPIFQILSRYINFFSIPASQEIVQHMTLWIGFVGAVIAALAESSGTVFSISSIFGFIAIVLAAINIFGGFLVTQRILQMYKKKKDKKK